MDVFGSSDLRSLTSEVAGPCVSVYLPTHVAGEQGQQDQVRLKNLLQEAEDQLADRWMRRVEARESLDEARRLPKDPVFWGARDQGLAIFIAPGVFQRYRLPLDFDELVTVSGRFHIKELLPLLSAGSRFLILALSQNKVRLFVATRHSIEPMVIPDLPANMEDALKYEGADRGSQVHSSMRGGLGKQAAVFHGQGGESDTHKDDLAQYFHVIDVALRPVLRDESAPLLLAGVDYLLPIFRESSAYAHIAETELRGNFDRLPAHEIHEQAWPLVESLVERAREAAIAKYGKLADAGRTSEDLRRIIPAAHNGQVETLFVDYHARQWGRFDRNELEVDVHDERQRGDDDLLDLATSETLLHRGAVHATSPDQMPEGVPLAAVFRY